MPFRRDTNNTLRRCCHLLLLLWLYTSVAFAQSQPEVAPVKQASASVRIPKSGDTAQIQANNLVKIGSLFRLRGNVQIRFRDFTVQAD